MGWLEGGRELEDFFEWYEDETEITSIDECMSHANRAVCFTTTKNPEQPAVLIFEKNVDEKIEYIWIFIQQDSSVHEEFYPPSIHIQYWRYYVPVFFIFVLIA